MELSPTKAALLLSGLISSSVLASPWNRSFSEVQALPSREPDRVIRYGDEPEQDVEAWLPSSPADAEAMVFLVHGGCWLEAYDRSHLHPLATALSERGYVVLLPEYRRVGQPGGGWPGTFKDIARAVDAIADLPLADGDPESTVLVGHSAGGHLALWAAARDRIGPGEILYREKPFMPRAVIGLAAITDLDAYARGDNSCQRVTPELMGGGPDERPGRYAQASPATLGASIPTFLLQGGEDAIVPAGQARALAGATPRLIEGAGHFDLIHPGTPAFGILLATIDEALGR